MLALYHWEPNANSGKPMLALAEKGVDLFGRANALPAPVPDLAGAAALPRLAGWLAGAHARARGRAQGARGQPQWPTRTGLRARPRALALGLSAP